MGSSSFRHPYYLAPGFFIKIVILTWELTVCSWWNSAGYKSIGMYIRRHFTASTKYSREATIEVWRSFWSSLLRYFSHPKQEWVPWEQLPVLNNRIQKLALIKTHVRYSSACFIHDYLLQNRMYFMTCSFVMLQFTTRVCQAKCKTNPSSIISFERQSRTLLQRVFFKGYLYNVTRYFNFASCFF